MIKTRFAPSPTGALHIGGVRTALFSFLFAKAKGGAFILRIEDTDETRSQDTHTQGIIEAMDWLGLHPDGEVVHQSHRQARYTACAEQLLASNQAYRCRCSKERLEALRESQLARKEKPRYDGHCRDLNLPASDVPAVIRFKTPQTGQVTFDDLVYGTITVSNSELDDLVMIRTDGLPTYNFAVVVDDADMQISHVIRGEDHINNTPRQIHLYQAFGWTLPQFAHLPMILGEDGKKLSKRHGAVNVLAFKEAGYLPEALLNALVRLGWSHQDQEIFSFKEMIKDFDLSHVSRSAAIFNYEKLDWLNQHYLKTLSPLEMLPTLAWQFEQLEVQVEDEALLSLLIGIMADRVKTLKELAEKSICYVKDEVTYDEAAVQKHLQKASKALFEWLIQAFSELSVWDKASLHEVIEQACAQFSLGMGKVAQPLRVALTGGTQSPSIDDTLLLVGRERTLKRLTDAATKIEG